MSGGGDQLGLHQLVLRRLRLDMTLEQEKLYIEQGKAYLSNISSRLQNLPSANIPIRMPVVYSDDRRRLTTKLGVVSKEGSPEYVPIRLDIDTDGYKLRDSFVWNLHEVGLTMEEFAIITCRDFDLPTSIFVPLIVKSIQTQVDEHKEAITLIRNSGGIDLLVGVRALIKLDITVGFLQLLDQFEWDLGELKNYPATFARQYCAELGLASEFITAIANDIMDQVNHLRRAILLVGFSRDKNGNVRINDPELQSMVFSSIRETRRDPNLLNDFSPILTEFDPVELERIELSRDRETRRKRRQTRGRRGEAANWTHIEAPKTIRTPLSYRGSLHRVMNRLEDDEGGESTSRSTIRSRRSRR